jgi:hypothetical protein
VNEAKNTKTGAVHSPTEFRADRRRSTSGAIKRRQRKQQDG